MRRFSAEDINQLSRSAEFPTDPRLGRILLVACQHGDEQFGLELRKMIESYQFLSAHVDTVVANPRAVRRNVRFIDFNMNRAFSDFEGETYEHRQARRVGAIAAQYPFVIDQHQATLKSINGVLLVDRLNERTRKIINAFGSPNVAVLPKDLASQGLIGALKHGRVAIETSNNPEDEAAARIEMEHALLQLATGRSRDAKPRRVFVVDGLVSRSVEVDPDVDYNFQPLPNDLGHGILFGDPAYANEDYHGFSAKTVIEADI